MSNPCTTGVSARSGIKEYDKAIGDYSEVIRLDPGNTMAYLNRGKIFWWVKKEYDRALKDLDEAIRLDPRKSVAYLSRGGVWYDKQDYTRALADFDEAIRLDPLQAESYQYRGEIYWSQKAYDKAITEFSAAIRIRPQKVVLYSERAEMWWQKKQYDKAVVDFTEAIRLSPENHEFYQYLAWLRATCPEKAYRDGETALALAMKACELSRWKEANDLDTLAAAHAELGDFESAVKSETRAIELSSDGKEEFASRLKLYKQKKPYRETVN